MFVRRILFFRAHNPTIIFDLHGDEQQRNTNFGSTGHTVKYSLIICFILLLIYVHKSYVISQAGDLGHRKRWWQRHRWLSSSAWPLSTLLRTYSYAIIYYILCAYNIVFLGSPPGADDKTVCSTPSGRRSPETYAAIYRSAGI